MHAAKGRLNFEKPGARRNKGPGSLGSLRIYNFVVEKRPTFLGEYL